MQEETIAGSDPRAAPRLIVPMSLQLAIPRRVALQQSSPPLHQPRVILKEKRKNEKEKSLNCRCANSKLSQQRGSPQMGVPSCTRAGLKGDARPQNTRGRGRVEERVNAHRTGKILCRSLAGRLRTASFDFHLASPCLSLGLKDQRPGRF